MLQANYHRSVHSMYVPNLSGLRSRIQKIKFQKVKSDIRRHLYFIGASHFVPGSISSLPAPTHPVAESAFYQLIGSVYISVASVYLHIMSNSSFISALSMTLASIQTSTHEGVLELIINETLPPSPRLLTAIIGDVYHKTSSQFFLSHWPASLGSKS